MSGFIFSRNFYESAVVKLSLLGFSRGRSALFVAHNLYVEPFGGLPGSPPAVRRATHRTSLRVSFVVGCFAFPSWPGGFLVGDQAGGFGFGPTYSSRY
jgi:hypothetical protein